MATENPAMRIVDSSCGGSGNWSSSSGGGGGGGSITSTSTSVVSDELGLLLTRGHHNNIHTDDHHHHHHRHTKIPPNRSGSAPPSMEGSFGTLVISEEEHLLLLQSSDSATYHHHSTNLNPRLLPRHSGFSGSTSRLPSADNRSGSGSMYTSRSFLSIHQEEDEPEDDREKSSSSSSTIKFGQNTFSFTGNRHKSLVDLIQEDFPRTPSPVFSQTHSSNHVEETSNQDIPSLSLDSLSLKASKSSEQMAGVGTAGVKTESSAGSTEATKDHSEASLTENPSIDAPGRSLSPWNDELTSKDVCFNSDLVGDGATAVFNSSSKSFCEVEDDQDEQELGFHEQNEPSVRNTYSQHTAGYHIPGSQVQGTAQGGNKYDMEKVPDGHVKMTSTEMQSLTHPPGPTHPLYATNAAYMAPGNSFYPNLGSSGGLYTPQQYSGYALSSSFLPPHLAGYSPNTGYPLHFNANSGQSFSGQGAGIPTSENISKGPIMQNSNRFYGHPGLTMHPNFPDPVPVQYFQHSAQDPYGVPMQYRHLPSPSMISSQVDSFLIPSDPIASSYTGDRKFQLPPNVSVSIPSPRKIELPSSSYLSSPTGLGFVTQFPGSPLGSPVLPESPVGSGSTLGRPYDFGFSPGSARNIGGWARWQGQRGADSINDHRKHSFLEELKASSAKRIDLADIVGRFVEFSIDQHGSRFIQQKLEICSDEEKELVFKEVLPHASKLITDVFGNYVIQKFFEHGTYAQRKELANQLSGQMLPLSLQMYGCRVIQKALEFIELDQKTELVLELDGHVMRCVRDQNGNHVIQKCIECLPPDRIAFIISSFKGQVAILSTHPYGCRVIQRVLERCSDDLLCRSVVDEILDSAYDLAQDQYGNYVTQHVLERGKPLERSQIISNLSGKIVQMSQHKYASNVVEKCLEFGDTTERELLVEEILLQSGDNDSLLPMMKDQFANYVVQKILEISNDKQREILLDRIRLHLIALRKYTYGKHIVARFEQLCGEDDGSCES